MDGKKRLYKVEQGKKICGVCAGIGKYFNIDPTFIRLAWAFFSLCFGTGVLAYFVCAFVFPSEEDIIQ